MSKESEMTKAQSLDLEVDEMEVEQAIHAEFG